MSIWLSRTQRLSHRRSIRGIRHFQWLSRACSPIETVSTPCQSHGEITLNIHRPASEASAQIAIYLPRGPILYDESHDALNAASLSATLSCPTVQINYRFTPRQHPWPTPLHDVMAGYDWIVANLLPHRAITRPGRSGPIGQIATVGELVGGTLAAALALTECRAGEPGVVAAAVNSPVLDWAGLEDEAAAAVAAATSPRRLAAASREQQKDEGAVLGVEEILRQRRALFRTPGQFFDPFASPLLLFRSAGVEVPPEYGEEMDEMESLVRGERERERDLAFGPSKEVAKVARSERREEELLGERKKRKSSRRYPSKALNLRLPAFYIAPGIGPVLKAHSTELALRLRQSFERQRRDAIGMDTGPVDEDPRADELHPGQVYEPNSLGLWDASAAGRKRMHEAAQWIKSALET